MSSPFNIILPEVGLIEPVIRLKNVVLPDPFGPMRHFYDPRSKLIEISLTAVIPPKDFFKFFVSKIKSEDIYTWHQEFNELGYKWKQI